MGLFMSIRGRCFQRISFGKSRSRATKGEGHEGRVRYPRRRVLTVLALYLPGGGNARGQVARCAGSAKESGHAAFGV